MNLYFDLYCALLASSQYLIYISQFIHLVGYRV